MKIDYSVGESDYLICHLYLASISERIKKQRLKGKVIFPLITLAVAVVNFILLHIPLAIYFLLISPLWYLLYPLWERRRYRKHYKRYVADTLKDRFGKMVYIEFTSDFFFAKDATSESKIANSEIEGIDEISSLIILRLKGGQSIPILQAQISDISSLKTTLQELANSLGIMYTEDLGWRWK